VASGYTVYNVVGGFAEWALDEELPVEAAY